jgi:hypothetical protein
LRLRLKASFDVSAYSPQIQVILRAMKKYGLILADNGSNWFISGAPDERWNNDMLRELKQIAGSNFEAVDVSSLMINANSGQALAPPGSNACDLNSDGSTNVTDVQLAINQALGLNACGAADLDGNGSCDIVDVQRWVNAALGEQCRVGD